MEHIVRWIMQNYRAWRRERASERQWRRFNKAFPPRDATLEAMGAYAQYRMAKEGIEQ